MRPSILERLNLKSPLSNQGALLLENNMATDCSLCRHSTFEHLTGYFCQRFKQLVKYKRTIGFKRNGTKAMSLWSRDSVDRWTKTFDCKHFKEVE